MRYSIVMPVYNVKDYLARCVDSVLAQQGDYEVILVDDGSTDGESGLICDRYAAQYPEKVRVIHQPNGGLGAARNTGIGAAAGDYLLFVDSDDYVDGALLTALDPVIDETGCDIVNFGMAVERGSQREEHLPGVEPGEVFTLAQRPFLLQETPSACCRAWKRRLFMESGVRYPGRVWYEDIRTSTKLFALAGSIVSIPRALYYYVERQGSITRNANADRNREILDAFDDILQWYEERGLREQYHRELRLLATEHVALSAAVRVLKIDPKHPLLEEFIRYMQAHFPDYRSRENTDRLSKLHRLLLALLSGRHYGLVRLLFRIKSR